MAETRILVAGAGALGSMYGGFLRRAGHAVTLLGRAAHLEAIRSAGLAIDGIFGRGEASGFELATTVAEIQGRFDLIVLATKSYDVAELAPDLAAHLAASGAVLALQNGMAHLSILADHFGTDRVIAGPVLIGATIPAAGAVRVTVYAKPVRISAPLGAADAHARRVAGLLAAAGIPHEAADHPTAYLWEKMLYNVALNALGAVLGLHYGALAERAESRRILDALIDEGFAVARAECADLPWASAEAFRRHFYETLLPPTAAHRSSMLQDIERGRRTEIDAINGHVCRRSEALGLGAVQNRIFCGLVRAIESNRNTARGAAGSPASSARSV